MFFVYIIFSSSSDRFYIGQTSDFEKRLKRHNAGHVISTRLHKPWQPVLVLEKPIRTQALILENKLKNLNRTDLITFIEKYSN